MTRRKANAGRRRKEVTITLYEYAGRKWFVEIKRSCRECTITAGMLTAMMKNELKGKPVRLAVRPWLTHAFSLLLKGGWHAPIVMINGKIISQGTVPQKQKIMDAVDKALRKPA